MRANTEGEGPWETPRRAVATVVPRIVSQPRRGHGVWQLVRQVFVMRILNIRLRFAGRFAVPHGRRCR